MLGYIVVQKTTFFCSCFPGMHQEVFLWWIVAPVLSCAGVPLSCSLIFSKCLLISFLVRPVPCLMTLVRIYVVGMNSAACKYFASYGFDVCTIMLFITAAGC